MYSSLGCPAHLNKGEASSIRDYLKGVSEYNFTPTLTNIQPIAYTKMARVNPLCSHSECGIAHVIRFEQLFIIYLQIGNMCQQAI